MVYQSPGQDDTQSKDAGFVEPIPYDQFGRPVKPERELQIRVTIVWSQWFFGVGLVKLGQAYGLMFQIGPLILHFASEVKLVPKR